MILDLLFVTSQLSLHFVQGRIDSDHQIMVGLVGDEIVFMFGLDEELGGGFVFLSFLEVDRHLDHREAIENVQEFESFLANLGLMRFAEVPVAD